MAAVGYVGRLEFEHAKKQAYQDGRAQGLRECSENPEYTDATYLRLPR